MKTPNINNLSFKDFNVSFNQESVENLFQQYERIGFIYPEKKALLAPHMEKITENWKTLASSKEHLLWILSGNHQDKNNFSSVSVWKQNNYAMQAQHLVSDGNPFLSLKVMLASQFKAEHHFTKNELNSSQNWFRPNNRYAYRIFASMYDKLGPQKSSLRLFHYLTMPLNNIPEFNSSQFEAVPVTGVDFELMNFVRTQYGEVFLEAEELNQSDIQLEGMNAAYAKYNLQRYRKVLKFKCKKSRAIKACVVVNRAPIGINFSFLENRAYFILAKNLTEKERITMLKTMNAVIKAYYTDFELGAIPIVTDDLTSKSLTDLNANFLRTYMQSIWLRSGFSLWFDHIYSFLRKIESRNSIRKAS